MHADLTSSPYSSFDRFLIRLKILRLGKGFSQQQVSEMLEIPLRTYQRIESGIAPLEIQYVYQLCEIFDQSYERMVAPVVSQAQDLPNVLGFTSLDEVVLPPPFKKKDILELKEKIFKLFHKPGVHFEGLHKEPFFKEHPWPLFYTDPLYAWFNDALRSETAQLNVQKEKNLKRLDNDTDFLINIWEYFLTSPYNLFLTRTRHDISGEVKEVYTLNFLDNPYKAPLNFGIKVKEINSSEWEERTLCPPYSKVH